MITQIRKSFKSKAYKIVLWLVILTMTGIFTLPQLFKFGSSGHWAARINGREIPYQEFMRKSAMHQEFLMNLRAQYGEYADAWLQAMGMNTDPRMSAMQELIQEELLNQAAQRSGIYVSTEYVSEKLANPLFVRQELAGLVPAGVLDQYGGINMQILKVYLQKIGLSMADFDEQVSKTVLRNLVAQLVRLAAYSPAFAVKDFYVSHMLRKKFSVLTIAYDDVLEDERENKIPEQELKAFFDTENAQSQRYFVPEKRNATVWHIDPKNYGISVSDQEINSYYEDNKAKKFVQNPAKVQVRHIFIRVANDSERPGSMEKARRIQEELKKSPERFIDLAKEQSDDIDTARNGGLMPAFSRGEQEREFEKAAFLLKENGDISDVVQTSKGYHLLQRMDKNPATYKSLENVKKEIVDALMPQKFREVFAKDMRALVDETTGIEGALEKALEAKGAKETKVENIMRDDPKWGAILFSLQKNGDVTYNAAQEGGQIVKLTKTAERYLPTLDSIQGTVENDIYEKRAAQKLKKMMKDLRKEAATKSFKQLQEETEGSLETTEWLSKEDNDALAALSKRGLPVRSFFQLQRPGSVADALEGKNGYLIRLDEVEPFKAEEFEAKKAEMAKELEMQEMRLYLAGFVASLYRSAKIEQNESPAPISEDYVPYED